MAHTFISAAEANTASQERATINLENNLREILENKIDPAIRNGLFYCTASRWEISESALDFLKEKGYTIEDKYLDKNSNYVISWGEVDYQEIFPDEVTE